MHTVTTKPAIFVVHCRSVPAHTNVTSTSLKHFFIQIYSRTYIHTKRTRNVNNFYTRITALIIYTRLAFQFVLDTFFNLINLKN